MAVGESAGAAADFKRELDFFASRARVLCSANIFPIAIWPGSLLALLHLLQW